MNNKKEVKFENNVLVSLLNGEELYHDDMYGEEVWINLRYKPEFLTSYDYREFNGIKIEDMARLLGDYDERLTRIDIKAMVDLRDLRINKSK